MTQPKRSETTALRRQALSKKVPQVLSTNKAEKEGLQHKGYAENNLSA